jgi:DHA1 family bicyclomycin/chloramphenicol resistance-like MFS transporter
VLTLFLAGIAAGQLVYGLSRPLRAASVLIAGLAVLAGTVLCGLAWSLPVLILGRTFGVGGCAGMVLGRAIVRDIYDRERSASALAIMMVMSLALTGPRDRPISPNGAGGAPISSCSARSGWRC